MRSTSLTTSMMTSSEAATTVAISYLLSKRPLKALRVVERQLKALKSWNIISVVNAMVRA